MSMKWEGDARVQQMARGDNTRMKAAGAAAAAPGRRPTPATSASPWCRNVCSAAALRSRVGTSDRHQTGSIHPSVLAPLQGRPFSLTSSQRQFTTIRKPLNPAHDHCWRYRPARLVGEAAQRAGKRNLESVRLFWQVAGRDSASATVGPVSCSTALGSGRGMRATAGAGGSLHR